jgi:hypothetical protein
VLAALQPRDAADLTTIFHKPRRIQDGRMCPPTEIEQPTAEALLLMTSGIENR